MKPSQLPLPSGFCELRPVYGDCKGGLHVHHILGSKLRGKARTASERPELLAWVCEWHNVSRYVDTKGARAYLLRKRARRYGEAEMRQIIGSLPLKIPFVWEQLITS